MHEIERTLNLNHYKWDTRLSGSPTLSRQPLIIDESEWTGICNCAETLAAETIALEAELCRHPEILGQLGMPDGLRRCLCSIDWSRSSPSVRTMRFDFHPTVGGWAVSEVNSDVPGGYNEATLLPVLFGRVRNYGRRPASQWDIEGTNSGPLDDGAIPAGIARLPGAG